MGKKRVSFLGDTISEDEARLKRQTQKEQKALREGKKVDKKPEAELHVTKAPGQKGGERVVDVSSESFAELERIEAKSQEIAAAVSAKPTVETPAKKTSHRLRSTRYTTAKAQLLIGKIYPLDTAVQLIRKTNLTHFPASLELHVNLIKQDAFNSSTVNLPHGTGLAKRVAQVTPDLLTQLDAGQVDFDILVASPAQMPQLVKYAKLLGPRGLMPNPKTGTLVPDPAAAVEKLSSANRLSLKSERKAPLVHTVVGKLSMSDLELAANIKSVVTAINPKHIQRIYLSSTMSPSVRVDPSSL